MDLIAEGGVIYMHSLLIHYVFEIILIWEHIQGF